MKIERILIEDQMAPIGLDEKKPAFSWLLTAEEGEQNLMQSACRIVVRTGEDTVWDSGKMETGIFLAADGRRRRTESDAERMPDRCAHRRRYCVGQRKNGNRRINRDWL